MKQNKIPTTRKAKIELLTAIQNGEKTIADFLEPQYDIELWRIDAATPGWMQTFDNSKRMTVKDYKAWQETNKSMNITLNLSN